MAEKASTSVVIVGGGPVALLTALFLHKASIPVTLVEAGFSLPPPAQNPELAYLWGDEGLPPLFQQSLDLWRSMPETLGLPAMVAPTRLIELSTSVGREQKLKQEALLEALGGEAVTFTPTLPPYLNKNGINGIKNWPVAWALVPGMLSTLQDAVTARGIPVHASPVKQLNLTVPPISVTLENGEVFSPQHIVMASAPAAKRLLLAGTGFTLPLRPARGHMLTYATPGPEGLPLIIHRLKRGHLFLVPQPNQTLHAYYDALLDPLQATTRAESDTALAAALSQHMANLIPSLAGQTPSHGTTTTHWLTPDFLPALGPWPTQPGFILAVGFNGREAALAPGTAALLTAHLEGEENVIPQEFIPNRFATGLWSKTAAPGSLSWNDPAATIVTAPLIAAEYMSNVNTIQKPAAQYASNVKQVEKTIVVAEKKMPEVRERSNKRKVQTASVKK